MSAVLFDTITLQLEGIMETFLLEWNAIHWGNVWQEVIRFAWNPSALVGSFLLTLYLVFVPMVIFNRERRWLAMRGLMGTIAFTICWVSIGVRGDVHYGPRAQQLALWLIPLTAIGGSAWFCLLIKGVLHHWKTKVAQSA